MGFKIKSIAKTVATKYNNPVSIYAGAVGKVMQSKIMPSPIKKVGNVFDKGAQVYSQAGLSFAKNYAKQYAGQYVSSKMSGTAFETAQDFYSDNQHSVQAGYDTTQYESTPSGLVPKESIPESKNGVLLIGALALGVIILMSKK